MGQRFGITDPGEHCGIFRHARIQSCLGLGDESALDLRPAALSESLIDDVEPRQQPEPHNGPWRRLALTELA